jgi:hypothetical protein
VIAPETTVDAETARGIAEGYLIDYVGSLLEAGSPQLSEDRRWIVPVLLGNARRGQLGQVGAISVDAETGEVLFSEEDRAKLKSNARLLAGAPS